MNNLEVAWFGDGRCDKMEEEKCRTWADGEAKMEAKMQQLADEDWNRTPWSERLNEEEVMKGLPGMMLNFAARRQNGDLWNFSNPYLGFEAMRKRRRERC